MIEHVPKNKDAKFLSQLVTSQFNEDSIATIKKKSQNPHLKAKNYVATIWMDKLKPAWDILKALHRLVPPEGRARTGTQYLIFGIESSHNNHIHLQVFFQTNAPTRFKTYLNKLGIGRYLESKPGPKGWKSLIWCSKAYASDLTKSRNYCKGGTVRKNGKRKPPNKYVYEYGTFNRFSNASPIDVMRSEMERGTSFKQYIRK